MTEISTHLNKCKEIIRYAEVHSREMTPQQLVEAKHKLSVYYYYLAEQHTQIKANFSKRWLDLRQEYETNQETDMRIQEDEAWRTYDLLKYCLRGLDKVISGLNDKIRLKENEARKIM